MAGDKIDIFGKSYFNSAASNTSSVPVLDILNGLLGTGAVSNSGKVVLITDLQNNSQFTTGIGSLLGTQSAGTPSDPKAYTNYIILDERQQLFIL